MGRRGGLSLTGAWPWDGEGREMLPPGVQGHIEKGWRTGFHITVPFPTGPLLSRNWLPGENSCNLDRKYFFFKFYLLIYFW